MFGAGKYHPKRMDQINPYLTIKNANQAINFYKEIFNAKELFKLEYAGKISHVEMQINDSILMFGDDFFESQRRMAMGLPPIRQIQDPKDLPVSLGVYVKDVDATFNKAIRMGAIADQLPENQFYGDRMASFIDPFGIKWGISQHIKDIPKKDIELMHNQMMDQYLNNPKMKIQNFPWEQYNSTNDIYLKKFLKYKYKYDQLKNQKN